MQEQFFTSKQAAQITSCTLRQLQYWRDKEVVVPAISGTGTGRSIYYSEGDLAGLVVMEYLLFLGLSFEICRETLRALQQAEPGFFVKPLTGVQSSRYMLWRREPKVALELGKYNPDLAAEVIAQGQPIIPLWIDLIQQKLLETMKALGYKMNENKDFSNSY